MRSSQIVTGALAVVATSALVGLGGAANAHVPDPSATSTSHERGALIECTGTAGSTPVRANLYQNKTFGNFLEVLVNDGTPDEAGRSLQAGRPFLKGSKVRASAKVAGKRLVITGTAPRTGTVKRIHDVYDDAGMRIVSTGTHRMLAPRLSVSFGAETGSLSCDNAFLYRLKVVKTSLVD